MSILLLEAPKTPPRKTNRDNDPERAPYLAETAETYCLWKALPSLFRYPPKDKSGHQPTPRDFARQMGIDEERILELIEIPTQKAFAEKFDVNESTLVDWNKTVVAKKSAHELMRYWASPLSKNVLLALYNRAIRSGMSFDVKLWFQLVEGFNERVGVDVTHRVIERIEFRVVEPIHATDKKQTD